MESFLFGCFINQEGKECATPDNEAIDEGDGRNAQKTPDTGDNHCCTLECKSAPEGSGEIPIGCEPVLAEDGVSFRPAAYGMQKLPNRKAGEGECARMGTTAVPHDSIAVRGEGSG
jgi:hypothetical protein